jgi:hypothetical protein
MGFCAVTTPANTALNRKEKKKNHTSNSVHKTEPVRLEGLFL